MSSLVPILAIGLSLVSGQDTTRTRWTLAGYLALVEGANPELTVARERWTAARARVGPARRLPDPMVEVGLMNRSLPGLGQSSPVAMDQIRIAQTVPVPGTLGAAAAAARARAVADSGRLEDIRAMLRWRTTEAAIELDRIDRATALLATFQPALAALAELARTRYAVGEAGQPDVIRAQVEAVRLGEELVMLRGERRTVVARLNGLAARDPGTPIDSIILPPSDSIPPLETLIDQARRDRPLLAARRAERLAADAERRRARLERWPELELGLGYGQQPMFDGSGTDRMVSFTVGATIPIWAGSRQREMRREADAMERMAAAEVAALEAGTAGRIGELVAEAERASELAALYRGTLLPQTRAAARSALAGYRVGGADFEAALSAQLGLNRLELDLIRLGADRARAAAELAYLTTGGAR